MVYGYMSAEAYFSVKYFRILVVCVYTCICKYYVCWFGWYKTDRFMWLTILYLNLLVWLHPFFVTTHIHTLLGFQSIDLAVPHKAQPLPAWQFIIRLDSGWWFKVICLQKPIFLVKNFWILVVCILLSLCLSPF